jgi:hypothetical protein|tara:strand:- start:1531 stop:2046 length:516 start_codon:yes stop_codon:yes gene_type:complete
MARQRQEPEQKKVRKKRKPMTAEQKAAAVERLAKARAARQAANPPQYKNIHPKVLALDEDDALSFNKVREWIKFNKELLSSHRSEIRTGMKGAESRAASVSAYINAMNAYLQCGDWIDGYYGREREHKITWRNLAMAYYPNGEPKRTPGVYYTDIGYVWGEQPEGLEELMA